MLIPAGVEEAVAEENEMLVIELLLIVDGEVEPILKYMPLKVLVAVVLTVKGVPPQEADVPPI